MKAWTALAGFAAVAISTPAAAQEAAGDWVGVLDVGGTRLPLVVHIRRDDAGVFTGTVDSPSQGAMAMPLADIALSEGRLAFKLPVVAGEFSGAWDATAKAWKGEWSQNGMRWPLDLAAPPPPPPLPANWTIPADEQIGALIAERIAPRPGQGLVVGAIEPGERHILAGGPQGGVPFNGDTVFEIGSISKVFTGLLLADMARRGEIRLDDPAEKYLPAGATMPSRNGRKITLADLSTHTSSLPRLPDNMPYGDPQDPYADYTEAQLLAFLAGHELTRDIGSQAEYSNLAVGLLGYLLGRAAGSDYETLLRERITRPLGMADTVITLSARQQARFAPPLDGYLQPTKPWHLPVLAGAGAIRSTANDMLKLAAAMLDPNSPLGPAMRTALSVRRASGNERVEQALGWQVIHPEPGREVLFHNGGTGGFRSGLVLEPAKGTAVVALANSAAEPSTTDLALRVLVGSPMAPTPPVAAAPPAPVTRAEVTLPVVELDRVVGRYEFMPGVVFNVTREGTQLRAQREGSAVGPVLPIFAEAPLAFFYKAFNGQFEFIADAGGTVTGAKLTLEGQALTGRRMDP